MSVTKSQWKSLYGLFDPAHRLEPAEMDLFVERHGDVAREIAQTLRAGLEPHGKWILCGSMGCGKSTELVRIAQLLANDYAVIGIDLGRSTARVDQLSAPEILFLVGAAALRAAGELWDEKLPPERTEALLRSFSGLVSGPRTINLADLLQGVALFAVSLIAPGSAAVAGAVAGGGQAARGALGNRLDVPVSAPQVGGLTERVREGDQNVVALQDAVAAILADVSRIRAPVVLVDGLDKIMPLPSIRGLFATSRLLAAPPVPIVYTAPITLMLAPEWKAAGDVFSRTRLTNIPVRRPKADWVDMDDSVIASGIAVLRDLVARRLRRVDLGMNDVFVSEEVLDLLLVRSGGLVRDLVHLVRRAIWSALLKGARRIGPDEAQAAVAEIRKEYDVVLTTRRIDELRHVRERGEPSGEDEASHELLLWSYVLPYSNGRVWFEPHPILDGIRSGL